MMFFENFEELKFLKIFDPQPQNFKNWPLAVEISADPKSWRIMTSGPKKSSDMNAPLFTPLFYDIMNFM